MISSPTQRTGYTFKPREHPDFLPVNRFVKKPVSPYALIGNIRDVLAKGDS